MVDVRELHRTDDALQDIQHTEEEGSPEQVLSTRRDRAPGEGAQAQGRR